MNKKTWVFTALGIGFAIAIMSMAIAIYFGYTYAYRTETDMFTVKLFGLPIYELTRSGEKYVGESIGINMGGICGICMVVSIIVVKIIHIVRHR